MNKYSDYFKTLDSEHSNRYLNKISVVNIDPYSIKLSDCSNKVEDYPNVLYPDIVNYLLYTKSAYTHQEVKAYKGLDAYKQANCGWVRGVLTKRCNNKIVVLGRVMHSQRISENCTNTWIITEDNGCVLSAHCDCVAGLGETCTHVCAILFFIDECLRTQTAKSVTDVKSQWVIPSKIAAPDKITNIEFGLSKKCLDDKPLNNRHRKISNKGSCSSQEDVVDFLSKLKLGDSVLHTIVKPFSSEIQKQLNSNKNACLSRLYEVKHEIDTLENLQNIGCKVDISISIDECRKIEKETNKQASSAAWYRYRAGRITASKFKAACKTKLERPSLSLIRSICYPLAARFKTTATIYGCKHEKEAFQWYTEKMKTSHVNFDSESVGLCLNPQYPHFGASPDGLVWCDCCNMGVLEIKCPYCAKDIGLDDLNVLKRVGMQKQKGQLQLNHTHPYYYQIQMQLAITGVDYCDFVVWSKKNSIYERILFDEEFWKKESAIATKLFNIVIMPELLGKYYTTKKEENPLASDWCMFKESLNTEVSCNTNPNICDSNESNTDVGCSSNDSVYCLCKGPDDGTPMIACSNLHCSVEWFHLSCVGLTHVPNPEWFCPSCTQ